MGVAITLYFDVSVYGSFAMFGNLFKQVCVSGCKPPSTAFVNEPVFIRNPVLTLEGMSVFCAAS